MAELKPCPFCRGEAIYTAFDGRPAIGGGPTYWCRCSQCTMAQVVYTVDYWNTRPLEDELAAEVERLRERVSELVEQADAGYAPYREIVLAARNEVDKFSRIISEKDGNIRELKNTVERMGERNADLELRLDLYHGNLMDVLQQENERLEAALEVAETRLSTAAGWRNINLVRELVDALGIESVPMDEQLQAALDAVKALKEAK